MVYAGLGLTIAGGVLLGSARKYKTKADDAKLILSFEPNVTPSYMPIPDRSAITGFSLKLRF